MAPQQRRSRSRRLALIAATAAASAALASGPGFAAGLGVVAVGDPPAPAPAAAAAEEAAPATVPAPPSAASVQDGPAAADAAAPDSPAPDAPAPERKRPAFGAYLDYGPRGVARMAELSTWLDGAEIRVGHTYLPGDRWSNIEGRPGFLDVWADWRTEQADRMLVLNVPMLERNEAGVSDAEVRRLLRWGAAGAYDHHFRRLAERLVQLQVPDTVIVLGWEMNGVTYTHRCGPDPASWKRYWNRIVTVMRSVPGQQLKFDFAPSRGRDAVPWTQCYPGDATVDIIGMDAYDQPEGLSFDRQVSEPYGLQAHVDFAKAHGKEISFPEWGLFRNGDNAEYMRRMLAWMEDHGALYHTVTDYCPHGVWQCRQNPRSAEVFRSVLSGRPDEPAPQPTLPEPTPEPTAPDTPVPGTPEPTPTVPTPQDPGQPPVNCSPLELGDWVEYWLGGKLCIRFDWWSRLR